MRIGITDSRIAVDKTPIRYYNTLFIGCQEFVYKCAFILSRRPVKKASVPYPLCQRLSGAFSPPRPAHVASAPPFPDPDPRFLRLFPALPPFFYVYPRPLCQICLPVSAPVPRPAFSSPLLIPPLFLCSHHIRLFAAVTLRSAFFSLSRPSPLPLLLNIGDSSSLSCSAPSFVRCLVPHPFICPLKCASFPLPACPRFARLFPSLLSPMQVLFSVFFFLAVQF